MPTGFNSFWCLAVVPERKIGASRCLDEQAEVVLAGREERRS
jgi:hypothetical protein